MRRRRRSRQPLVEGAQPSPGRVVDRLVRHANVDHTLTRRGAAEARPVRGSGLQFLSQPADGNRIPDRLEVSVKLILPFGPALILLSLQGVAGAQTLQMPLVEIGGQIGLVGAIAEGVHTYGRLPAPASRSTFPHKMPSSWPSRRWFPTAVPGFTGCTLFNTDARPGTRPIGVAFDRSSLQEPVATTPTEKFPSTGSRVLMARSSCIPRMPVAN